MDANSRNKADVEQKVCMDTIILSHKYVIIYMYKTIESRKLKHLAINFMYVTSTHRCIHMYTYYLSFMYICTYYVHISACI